MAYEVELKFAVDDFAPLRKRLDGWDVWWEGPIAQEDHYLSHPQRDFAETDEALRLRTIGDRTAPEGQRNRLTYKGPLLDERTKTRHEVEVSFADGTEPAARLLELLGLLGFRAVRTVSKVRTPCRFEWEGFDVELVFDEVADLGRFVEIEMLADEPEPGAPHTSHAGLRIPQEAILRLAAKLGLANPIRTSYLCLLLEQDRERSRDTGSGIPGTAETGTTRRPNPER